MPVTTDKLQDIQQQIKQINKAQVEAQFSKVSFVFELIFSKHTIFFQNNKKPLIMKYLRLEINLIIFFKM